MNAAEESAALREAFAEMVNERPGVVPSVRGLAKRMGVGDQLSRRGRSLRRKLVWRMNNPEISEGER